MTSTDFDAWGRVIPLAGVDMDAARASVLGSDAALEAAWRPLADAFARVVLGQQTSVLGQQTRQTRL